MSEVPQFMTVLYGIPSTLKMAEAAVALAADDLQGVRLEIVSTSDVAEAVVAMETNPKPVSVMIDYNSQMHEYRQDSDDSDMRKRVVVAQSMGAQLIVASDRLDIPRAVYYAHPHPIWSDRRSDRLLKRPNSHDIMWDRNEFITREYKEDITDEDIIRSMATWQRRCVERRLRSEDA